LVSKVIERVDRWKGSSKILRALIGASPEGESEHGRQLRKSAKRDEKGRTRKELC